ncbi:uncharacterized protein PGTG_01918 [Puccinia graminis f. sp. tritici CRL 75-36-700-3]|uniref:Uncharacterized protein n=1 Tax=Puccinia graminis f. sp. tritici (strain CRL 75-36-700-3 / race SCCL) TaxID=418459 RepID=E3JTK0_PUCGT|nr:uncharacterized protein PGTG_01918 [Puccinia graminis f. sp. tritici CRL 75-36-700-3]EFP75325.1 hypothetical protein PGTG_01918 [Puccinia graminis f. sp. tritici CRL 75-36-700-3]
MFSRPVDPLWTERQKKLDLGRKGSDVGTLQSPGLRVRYNGQGLEKDLIKSGEMDAAEGGAWCCCLRGGLFFPREYWFIFLGRTPRPVVTNNMKCNNRWGTELDR